MIQKSILVNSVYIQNTLIIITLTSKKLQTHVYKVRDPCRITFDESQQKS